MWEESIIDLSISYQTSHYVRIYKRFKVCYYPTNLGQVQSQNSNQNSVTWPWSKLIIFIMVEHPIIIKKSIFHFPFMSELE